MTLTFANQMTKQPRWFTVIGKPKNGKTVFACTASEYAPELLPALEPVYLKDTLVLQFDTGGVESAERLGLIPYVHDLSTLTEYAALIKGTREAVKVAMDAVLTKGVRYIIVDTITTFDLILSTRLGALHSGQDLWKTIQKDHMEFALALKQIPATIIFLFHMKYNHAMIEDKAGQYLKQEARQNTNSLPGESDYTLAITGKSGDFYRGAGSGLLAVYKKLGNKKQGKPSEYICVTDGLHGFEAGTRFPEWETEEPAHFGKMLKKLERK